MTPTKITALAQEFLRQKKLADEERWSADGLLWDKGNDRLIDIATGSGPLLVIALLDCIETLEYYANHESVIKEAYASSEGSRIRVVHTFINHKANDCLARLEEMAGKYE